MSQGHGAKVADRRRILVEHIAASRYVGRSARLRDLLVYLSERVLAEDAGEIHEQEVGHKVFGRPVDYDTTADNIVRVHASMLRKRLEQYFAAEGASEPMILEIPKGNYAPVFREREELEAPPSPSPLPPRAADRRVPALLALTALFACTTVFLLLRPVNLRSTRTPAGAGPTVRLFWSQLFPPKGATDIVLDDAALGLYQELTGKSLSLANYFDRDYLRSLPGTAAAANLDEPTASRIVLRRHSNFADASFLWKLFQMPGVDPRHTNLRFARDYSFRELKADNAILLGNSRSNPWVEPFEAKLGLRWVHDPAAGTYYPLDTWTGGKSYRGESAGDPREGYCGISLIPNLGGSGSVLLVAGTGGSAMNTSAAFLADEQAMADLRRKLPATKDGTFPYFEALIKVKGRSASVRDAVVVICRTLAQ